jgi:glycosyltransferase involved in cell wall biosynthesis
MNLGIDAVDAGSGGAKRYLINLLENAFPEYQGVAKVYIWAPKDILDIFPNPNWLKKKTCFFLNNGKVLKLFWKLFLRDYHFNKEKINFLFAPFGTYLGFFRPYVTMSHNMLLFDNREMSRFKMLSTFRIKLEILSFIQKKCFENSDGLIFISQYAQREILNKITLNKKIPIKLINFGVENILESDSNCKNVLIPNSTFKFLYVSPVWRYKHQCNVVKAICKIRELGYNISLDLVGSDDDRLYSNKLRKLLESNGSKDFITWHKKIGLSEVKKYYRSADAFIFASTCENMPNILLEAMSARLPIACSNSDPMPEFLMNSALYFDPEDVDSIINVLLTIFNETELRNNLAISAHKISLAYKWENCSKETFKFLSDVYKKNI